MQTSNPTKYAEVTAKLDEANQKKMAQMTIASYNSLF
jgi:hypothetical protein